MKYGLTKEIRTAKEYVDRGPNKKLHKSGRRVNSAFCGLGASPDVVVYDLHGDKILLESLKPNVHFLDQMKNYCFATLN